MSAREDLARLLHQVAQQAQLVGHQCDRLVLPPRLQRGEIEAEFAEAQGARYGFAIGQLHRQHAIEHGPAIDRPDDVVVRTGAQGPALGVGIVFLEDHCHVRLLGHGIAAQPAAQFEARQFGQEPVDESPGPAVEEGQRAVPAPGVEHHLEFAMGERIVAALERVGQQNVDLAHGVPVRKDDWALCGGSL